MPYGDNITDGPGYRLWNLVSELKRRYEVVILSVHESVYGELRKEKEIVEDKVLIKAIPYTPTFVAKSIREEEPDCLLFTPWSSLVFASAVRQYTATVVDYVGSSLMENLLYPRSNRSMLTSLKLKSFRYGDFMMCTNERQRYYLLGLYFASMRAWKCKRSPEDPIIHVVPMTYPSEPPLISDVAARKNDEFTILLMGALLPWYDYETLFKALHLLNKKTQAFRLVIMGGNAKTLKFDGTTYVKKLAHDYGLEDRTTITGLFAFRGRASFYSQADIGLVLGMRTLEDELSTRTRILDYLWGRLPIVTSGNDTLSDLAVSRRCGLHFNPGDYENLFQIFHELAKERRLLTEYRKNIESVLQKDLNPSKCLEPLASFLENPKIDTCRQTPFSLTTSLALYLNYLSGNRLISRINRTN
jgi:glycosyltransferase involved in cell wall biosynthesis